MPDHNATLRAVDPQVAELVDRELVRQRNGLELIGADPANVQPHAGSQANFAAFMAVAKPGELILAMSLPHGGHLSHGHSVNHSGVIWRAQHYGVDPATGLIDYDRVRDLARTHRPRLIVAGGSAYSRLIDF